MTVLSGVGFGAVVGKILPTPAPARSRMIPPSTGDDFWPNSCDHPENIETAGSKESCNMEIKLKRHLAMKFRLIKGFGDNFKAVAIVV